MTAWHWRTLHEIQLWLSGLITGLAIAMLCVGVWLGLMMLPVGLLALVLARQNGRIELQQREIDEYQRKVQP